MKLRVIEINEFNLVAARHELVELSPTDPRIVRQQDGKEVLAVRLSSLEDEADVVELLLRVTQPTRAHPIPFKLKGTGTVAWPEGHPNATGD